MGATAVCGFSVMIAASNSDVLLNRTVVVMAGFRVAGGIRFGQARRRDMAAKVRDGVARAIQTSLISRRRLARLYYRFGLL